MARHDMARWGAIPADAAAIAAARLRCPEPHPDADLGDDAGLFDGADREAEGV